MAEIEKQIKLAVNGGIGFGSKLNAQQLILIAEYLGDQELELTTFQQLYIQVAESDVASITKRFNEVGLAVYPVGNYVKSLRHCNFCKGEEQEGMPIAKEINRRIAGKSVPFTLRPAYAGCPIGCGEPLVNDIGVLKVRNGFDLYIGGNPKGVEARVGKLVKAQLQPDELYSLIDKIVAVYTEHGKKRESFSKFLNRYGFDTFTEQILIKEKF